MAWFDHLDKDSHSTVLAMTASVAWFDVKLFQPPDHGENHQHDRDDTWAFGDIPGVLPSFLPKGQIRSCSYCLFSDISFSNSESDFSWISLSWKNLVSIVAKTLLL